MSGKLTEPNPYVTVAMIDHTIVTLGDTPSGLIKPRRKSPQIASQNNTQENRALQLDYFTRL